MRENRIRRTPRDEKRRDWRHNDRPGRAWHAQEREERDA